MKTCKKTTLLWNDGGKGKQDYMYLTPDATGVE